MNGQELQKLGKIYSLLDSETYDFPLACQKGCDLCCTDRLSLTTLEGRFIAEFLMGNEALLNMPGAAQISWKPAYTVNGLVLDTLCRRNPPSEDDSMPVGTCPLLQDSICLVYPVRPLACRVMFSRSRCGEGMEEAQISPLEMSLNQVFLQAVEHLDSAGRSGNLSDIMDFVLKKSDGERLLHNRPMPGFLIPPEHQEAVMHVVAALKDILEND